MSQADIYHTVFINAPEEPRPEEGETRRTKHPQDHLWQDIWCFLYQMIEKFTIQLLTLCLLVFIIWMLGLFVIANAFNTAVTPRPRRQIIVSPSSNNKPTHLFFNSVLSARDHQPNRRPFQQQQPNIPILQSCHISPRSSTNTYVNSILSVRDHQLIHTLERIPDERQPKLRRVAFCREWNLQ